ncbi:hypothetical protein [Sphingomonas fuzhouensis]|uniref:hypothetical protein n=1 Tax=Sphingomonas fuzhouensis TaxID=3106033 RepID=UPI002B00197F|nr:hypothetical protein [Sphingomonas sp. SGZ-02]
MSSLGAGSVASQAVGIATGIQDKFSFKSVALAAIGGGVAGALTKVIPGTIGGSEALSAAARGAAGSAITQGIGVATGLQRRFGWAGVAAAGIGAGVSTAVGNALGVNRLSLSAGDIAGTLVAGTAGAIANAATRSIAQDTSFGDNILSALPDVIASTVGSVVQASVARAKAARPVIAEPKQALLGDLGLADSIRSDGRLATNLSRAELQARVDAVNARRSAGQKVQIGFDDDIVVGGGLTDVQQVTAATRRASRPPARRPSR